MMKPINKQIRFMAGVMALMAISLALFAGDQNPSEEQGDIRVTCSQDLLEIAVRLEAGYEGTYPGADIVVTPFSGELQGVPASRDNVLALVTKQDVHSAHLENYWSVVVGRDALVPVMNAENPLRSEITEQGISPAVYTSIYTSGQKITWGELTGLDQSTVVNPYFAGDPTGRSYLTNFIGSSPVQLKGTGIEETGKITEKILTDVHALGFCRLEEIIDPGSGEILAGLSLIPIDMNGNGQIDNFEDIYRSAKDLVHGIWIGKYPETLYSRLYMMAGTRPTGATRAFVEWVVSEGQSTLAQAGFTGLMESEQYARREQLAELQPVAIESTARVASSNVVLIVVGSILLLSLIVLWVVSFIAGRSATLAEEGKQTGLLPDESTLPVPRGLFFDKSHTWAFMEKDGRVRIGIDRFLQQVTGPITRVILKKPGENVKRGESLLTLVQHGKKLEIKSPVTGVIAERNSLLENSAAGVNEAPFSEGWVYMVEPVNWLSELKTYAMGEKYKAWIKAEYARLKDLLAEILKPSCPLEPVRYLQEGGEITPGILESYGPDVWEEFQTRFINSSR